MKDELRDEIAYEYRKWNPSASIGRALEFADSVLSLIDAERCVWKLTCFGWETECGNKYPYMLTQMNKCCSFCGKRIEVKEVKDGQ